MVWGAPSLATGRKAEALSYVLPGGVVGSGISCVCPELFIQCPSVVGNHSSKRDVQAPVMVETFR